MRPLTLEELDQVAGGQPWDSTDDCQSSFGTCWGDLFYTLDHSPAVTTAANCLLTILDPDGDADADGIPNGSDIDPLHNRYGIDFKIGANVANLINEIKIALPIISEIANSLGLPTPVITSGNDGYYSNGQPIHKIGSLHYQNAAIDIRGNNITDAQLRAFSSAVSARLGTNFDVQAEFFVNPVRDHLHVEYDPEQR